MISGKLFFSSINERCHEIAHENIDHRTTIRTTDCNVLCSSCSCRRPRPWIFEPEEILPLDPERYSVPQYGGSVCSENGTDTELRQGTLSCRYL